MPERSLRVKAPGGTLEFHLLNSSFHRGDLTAVAPHFHPQVKRAVYMQLLTPLKFLQAVNANLQTDSSVGGKRVEAAAEECPLCGSLVTRPGF